MVAGESLTVLGWFCFLSQQCTAKQSFHLLYKLCSSLFHKFTFIFFVNLVCSNINMFLAAEKH